MAAGGAARYNPSMMIEALSTQLWLLTLKRASPEAAAWLASFPEMDSPCDFAEAFEELERKMGQVPVALTEAEAGALREAGSKGSPDGWSLTDLGRAALLTSAARELPSSDFMLLLAQCAARGEGNRRSVLLAMTILPQVSLN